MTTDKTTKFLLAAIAMLLALNLLSGHSHHLLPQAYAAKGESSTPSEPIRCRIEGPVVVETGKKALSVTLPEDLSECRNSYSGDCWLRVKDTTK